MRSQNPATGALLGEVTETAPEAVDAVVQAVAQVQPVWAALTLGDRARYLQRTAQVLLEEGEEIRDLIAAEQGKPRLEALTTEVLPAIDALGWIAREGRRRLADERIALPVPHMLLRRAHHRYAPIGVIGVLGPSSYPWNLPLVEIALALMAGNGAVLKPASLTPLTGERIRRAFERAGVPEGLVQVIHGPGTGPALVTSSVAKISLAGSHAAGRSVAEACAREMKPSQIELGTKGPMIVLADADLEHAVAGALWAGFANCGQSGAGAGSVYVARELADAFLARLVAGARALRVGDPLNWDTEIGPMSDPDRHRRVTELLEEASAQGAEVHCGGPVGPPAGLAGRTFFAPAVLTGVTPQMSLTREGAGGPVLPVTVAEDDADAVRLAGACAPYGSASVWTSDRERGERLARELPARTVWLNEHLLAPRRAEVGLHDYADRRVSSWTSPRVRDPRWFPYDETLGRALRHAATVLYGRSSIKGEGVRAGAAPLARVVSRTLRNPRP